MDRREGKRRAWPVCKSGPAMAIGAKANCAAIRQKKDSPVFTASVRPLPTPFAHSMGKFRTVGQSLLA